MNLYAIIYKPAQDTDTTKFFDRLNQLNIIDRDPHVGLHICQSELDRVTIHSALKPLLEVGESLHVFEISGTHYQSTTSLAKRT